MTERDTAWAKLHEPTTDAATLAEIVTAYPEFATTAAGHPHAYEELKAWAASLEPTIEITPPAQPSSGLSEATNAEASTYVSNEALDDQIEPWSPLTRGLITLGGAAVIFVICSIVQGIGGSSMFAIHYYKPDNFLLDLLMNVTFWPGWLLTGALVILGIKTLFAKKEG